MPSDARTPREVLELYRKAILEQSADDLADLYSGDAVHELPFLFPGMPDRLVGPEQIRAAYGRAWAASSARPQEIRDEGTHDTADPEVIVVEQVVAGVDTVTGTPFSFPGVLVMQVHDGRLVRVRDYMDGLRIAHTFGRLEASSTIG